MNHYALHIITVNFTFFREIIFLSKNLNFSVMMCNA